MSACLFIQEDLNNLTKIYMEWNLWILSLEPIIKRYYRFLKVDLLSISLISSLLK
jgi:hypothetical protein